MCVLMFFFTTAHIVFLSIPVSFVNKHVQIPTSYGHTQTHFVTCYTHPNSSHSMSKMSKPFIGSAVCREFESEVPTA